MDAFPALLQELADIIERYDTDLVNADGSNDQSEADYRRAHEIIRSMAEANTSPSAVPS